MDGFSSGICRRSDDSCVLSVNVYVMVSNVLWCECGCCCRRSDVDSHVSSPTPPTRPTTISPYHESDGLSPSSVRPAPPALPCDTLKTGTTPLQTQPLPPVRHTHPQPKSWTTSVTVCFVYRMCTLPRSYWCHVFYSFCSFSQACASESSTSVSIELERYKSEYFLSNYFDHLLLLPVLLLTMLVSR